MATSNIVRTIIATSAAALTIYRMGIFNSAGKFIENSVSGGIVDGIAAQTVDAIDKAVPVVVPDGAIVKVEAGATVANGANLMSDTVGRAITATATNNIMLRALEAGAVGEIIKAQFVFKGVA